MTEKHPFQSDDVATRTRAIRESIAAKQARRPKVNAQGKVIGDVKLYEYDAYGQLIGPADETDPQAAT